MDINDVKSLNVESKKRMDSAIDHVRKELAGLRSGRASVSILDPVHVEAYGTQMPLNQVANLSVPEPALIIAQPFDPSLLGPIDEHGRIGWECKPEKAAASSNATMGELPQAPQ